MTNSKIIIEDYDEEDTPIMANIYNDGKCDTGVWMDKFEINGDFLACFLNGIVILSKNISKYVIIDNRIKK